VVVGVVPAFLIECGLYVSSGFASIRSRLEALPRTRLAALLVGSAVLPYCVYSIATGVFSPTSALAIGALAAIPAFWYIAFGPRTWADAAFLVLMALPVLSKTFRDLYADPVPRLQLFVLGLLMWYRLGIIAILCLRRMEGIGFSFVPKSHEWTIGLRNFVFFLPAGLLAALALGFVHLAPVAMTWRTVALALVTFVVTLWVLAAAEEFFFRGLLQQMLTRVLGGEALGIIVASAIFGLSHLGRGDFPNWRFALLAAFAGLFYGRAYSQAGSIRAAMVTHALVVTTWRVFLT
jgi:membrane protease YdiL (CAAX protease family)